MKTNLLSQDDAAHMMVSSGQMGTKSPRWAAALLLAGTISATLAFSLATLAGTVSLFITPKDASAPQHCFPNRVCESGKPYHPETVSELVSKRGSAEEKIFYGFAIIASICLIVSRYPMELSNVRTPITHTLATPHVRALIPPIGMMIVAQIPVVPQQLRNTLGIILACSVHTTGAVLFVGGYLYIEARTLSKLHKKLSKLEKVCRWTAVVGGVLSAVAFAAVGALLGTDYLQVCCKDEYKDIGEALKDSGMSTSDVELWREFRGGSVLWNSADQEYLILKKCEFWSEMSAGVFIVLSHFWIWWFCEERHYEFNPPTDRNLEE